MFAWGIGRDERPHDYESPEMRSKEKQNEGKRREETQRKVIIG